MPDLTPEQIKAKEDLAKLTKTLQDAVSEAKEGKFFDTPEFQEKMGKIIMDQIEAGNFDQILSQKARINGEYEANEDLAKRFNYDAYPQKMLMPVERAKMHYGEKFGNNLAYAQELNDRLTILVPYFKHQAWKNQTGFDIKTLKTYNEYMRFVKSDKELEKALATTATNLGAEWVPTGFSAQVAEAIALQTKVEALFPSLSMPTNPYTIPVDLRGTGAFLIAQNTSGSSPTKVPETGTSNVTDDSTLTAAKIGARLVFSEELNEDSIVNLIAFSSQRMATDLAEGAEDAIINGDDNGTHMDADVTGTTNVKEAFDGLRYYALNNGTTAIAGGNGAPTIDMVRSMRGEMGKYGVNPKNLALIVGLKVYQGLLGIEQVETLEKYGGQFTALAGALGVIDGMPIVVSEFSREVLNASGVQDGVTTDRATMLIAHRPSFMVGNRGSVQINTLMDIEVDQVVMVAKRRLAFQNIYGATEDNVSITVNLDA